jgi:hypothetical protein
MTTSRLHTHDTRRLLSAKAATTRTYKVALGTMVALDGKLEVFGAVLNVALLLRYPFL